MSLKGNFFKIHYNTDEDDVVNDFYCKAIKNATLYKRAAGFFSSSSLMLISKGIEELLKNDGKMQLLVSPKLSKEDIEAITLGYANREDIICDTLIREFNIHEYKDIIQYNYLAWLIYQNKLDIRVVVKKDLSSIGIFHDKFGVIYDDEQNIVAFHGSMNESETAYIDNYESINVFLSWDERDYARVCKYEERFDAIWKNGCNNWETFEFPQALKNEILQLRSSDFPFSFHDNKDELNFSNTKVSIPDSLKLRDYQENAIIAWIKNKGKGIFEMATGTGKTITSIAAMVRLIEFYNKKDASCGIVIVVPYKILLEQWEDNLAYFNIYPIKCYESKAIWKDRLSTQINIFNNNIIKNLFVITTNATFRTTEFQFLLNEIKQDCILCIDEMHHFTSEESYRKLPMHLKYKLGLSATLVSKYNETSMQELIKYFENGIIYDFPLDKAIDEGFLTKYYYNPIFVELNDAEKDEYFEITYKIGQKLSYSNNDMQNEDLQKLFIKRARIIASAENKLVKLKELKNLIKDTYYNLFYCGDKIEADERFIEKVNKVLAFDIGIKTHTFTSEENRKERQDLIKDFAGCKIQALTAIRCLDEGVDIPELRRAFILSSGTNPKEFIQRRGRILRRSEGKEFAEIYDFIVVPTLDKNLINELDPQELKCEQKVLVREFERFKEFADLAINKQEAYSKILDVWKLYDKE